VAVFKGVECVPPSKRKGGSRKSRKADRSKLCKTHCVALVVKKQGRK